MKLSRDLFKSRPTAVNLQICLERMEKVLQSGGDLEKEAEALHEEDGLPQEEREGRLVLLVQEGARPRPLTPLGVVTGGNLAAARAQHASVQERHADRPYLQALGQHWQPSTRQYSVM